MDGRDYAKCQKSRKWTHWKLLEKNNENKTKLEIVVFSIFESKMGKTCSGLRFEVLERESVFSLDFSSFGPSVRFGLRSKVVLRGEGYAWTPIWWSSDNSKR